MKEESVGGNDISGPQTTNARKTHEHGRIYLRFNHRIWQADGCQTKGTME